MTYNPAAGAGGSLFSRKRVTADGVQAVGDTDTVALFPTAGLDTAGDLTESAGVFTVVKDGNYIIFCNLDFQDTGVFNIVSFLELDTGSGFASIEETVQFQGASIRNSTSMHATLNLGVGDEIRVIARDTSSPSTPTPDLRDGCQISFLKI